MNATFPYGKALDLAFTDATFLNELISDPRAALAKTGVNLDAGVEVKVDMNGNAAGGVLNIDVKNAAVNWAGSVNLTLHK